MAVIVGALGIPHNPFTAPGIARGENGVRVKSRGLYAQLATALAQMRADTLVVFTTDHYNLFFELSVPIFAIGGAESSSGPSEYRCCRSSRSRSTASWPARSSRPWSRTASTSGAARSSSSTTRSSRRWGCW